MPASKDKYRTTVQLPPDLVDQIDELLRLMQQRRSFSRRAHRNDLIVAVLSDVVPVRLKEERKKRGGTV